VDGRRTYDDRERSLLKSKEQQQQQQEGEKDNQL